MVLGLEQLYYKGAAQAKRVDLEALREQLSGKLLKEGAGYAVLHRYTEAVDSMMLHAWKEAAGELPLLREREREHASEECQQLRSMLEMKQAEGVVEEGGAAGREEAYVAQVRRERQERREGLRQRLVEREACLLQLEGLEVGDGWIGERLVLFARGGYGRAELSFASDLDIGWCLSGELDAGGQKVVEAFVLRVQQILREGGLQPEQQVFVMGEDLQRFCQPATLHTATAVWEGRWLCGSESLLGELKQGFFKALPLRRYADQKLWEFGQAAKVGNAWEMDIKRDCGGLRSVQVALWLLGARYRSGCFGTAELLSLAVEKSLILPWEAEHLVEVLELYWRLRGMLGVAERYYYTREVQERGLRVEQFSKDGLNESLVRLLIFHVDAWETPEQLGMVLWRASCEAEEVSRRLLHRGLDCSVRESLGWGQAEMHLGERRVEALLDNQGQPLERLDAEEESAGDAAGRQLVCRRMLDVFICLAESGFTLSEGLGQLLLDAVAEHMPVDSQGTDTEEVAVSCPAPVESWQRMLGGRYAQVALREMWQLRDGSLQQPHSILERFLPELQSAHGLLRSWYGMPRPLHQQVLDSLQAIQQTLDWLHESYPELRAAVGPPEALLLKQTILLLGVLYQVADPAAKDLEHTASMAASLGLSPQQEPILRILLEHHSRLLIVCRTSAYLDQALTSCFELAARSPQTCVLLFLVNIAILNAQPDASNSDKKMLSTLFEEAAHILIGTHSIPGGETGISLINAYLDDKKAQLRTQTQLVLLQLRCLEQGFQQALFQPLQQLKPTAWKKLQPHAASLEKLQQQILISAADPEISTFRQRLSRQLRQLLSNQILQLLTQQDQQTLNWIFAAFPNRYLLSTSPEKIAGQFNHFAQFQQKQVIVDSSPSPAFGTLELIIHLQNLDRPHSRVAHALTLCGLQVLSGKINQIQLQQQHAYCYYFRTSQPDSNVAFSTRDLQRLILERQPPLPPSQLLQNTSLSRPTSNLKISVQPPDKRSYLIQQLDKQWQRIPQLWPHIQIRAQDTPFFFLKTNLLFELFQIEITQALITTSGEQVTDYFYTQSQQTKQLLEIQKHFPQLIHSSLNQPLS